MTDEDWRYKVIQREALKVANKIQQEIAKMTDEGKLKEITARIADGVKRLHDSDNLGSLMSEQHPGRWLMKFAEYQTSSTQLAHCTKGEIAETRNYILLLEAKVRELEEQINDYV